MFIYELIMEYKKRFGIKNVFLKNVKTNKWIVLYLFISISFPIIILFLFYNKSILWMVFSIILYLAILFFGGIQHRRKMYNSMPPGSLSHHTMPFRDMLKDVFSITTDEQYLRLDEILKREIASVENDLKYPLMDIVRQLIVALIVTGLLSYAVFEIREGNFEQAKPLLATYLLIIGGLFAVGGFLKQIREFGSSSCLVDISILIQLSLLENSIRVNKISKEQIDNIAVLPSRKNKLK